MESYASRINRVMDYIEEHLSEELTLEHLASVAFFSPYHFHRIFQSIQGETLFQFIQRIRLEKAAFYLKGQPDLPIIEVAQNCGFNNPAAFSRAFKLRFKKTPSQWRKDKNSNLSIAHRNIGKESFSWTPYIEYNQSEQLWVMRNGEERRLVVVKDLPATRLLYLRYQGPYAGDSQLFHRLWDELYRWAGSRGLIKTDTQYIVLYHDDPELTKKKWLRVSLAITVDDDVEAENPMGIMFLPEGRYGCAQFRLNSQEYGKAWNWVYQQWLPQSGYLPADGPSMEWFPKEEGKSEDGRHRVDICVPLLLPGKKY